jgi:hypothetical protein
MMQIPHTYIQQKTRLIGLNGNIQNGNQPNNKFTQRLSTASFNPFIQMNQLPTTSTNLSQIKMIKNSFRRFSTSHKQSHKIQEMNFEFNFLSVQIIITI